MSENEGAKESVDDPNAASLAVGALSAFELSLAMDAGELSAVDAVEQLIGRIEAIDRAGPSLRSVIELSPDALDEAARLDEERRAGKMRGRLHGVPVLLKDNIDTVAPLHTTAGSFVFGESSPGRDASLVSSLREAGLVVLGKANLSQWANYRSRPSASGWSALGGQVRNPHALDRTPGGSSAGSGAAVAARLVPLAIGTETDGSILCPASANGIVALKPTVGLVSRTGIIPISESQDTAGPMARSVEDLAIALELLAGTVDDPEDPRTAAALRPAGHSSRYLSLLGDGSLEGVRIGVLRDGGFIGYHPPTDKVFEEALEALRGSGASVVDVEKLPNGPLTSGLDELEVLAYEFARGIEAYFARRLRDAPQWPEIPQTIEQLIEETLGNPAERSDVFGVQLFEVAAERRHDGAARYEEALMANLRRSRTEGLDALFYSEDAVELIAVPGMPPAWLVDHVIGDGFVGSGWSPPAVAGYPSAAIPVGAVGGLPVSMALWGPAFSEQRLLRVMFALEKALGRSVTSPRPRFLESVSIRA